MDYLAATASDGHAIARLELQAWLHSKGRGAAHHLLDYDAVYLLFQLSHLMSAGLRIDLVDAGNDGRKGLN